MRRLIFRDRPAVIAAAIDFLLSHSQLKFTEILLGIMILRHTVLFGKTTDQMTRKQQRDGVGHLNRGTGRSLRRLSAAASTLARVGFVRITKAEGRSSAFTYTLLVDNILEYTQQLRSSAATPRRKGARKVDRPEPQPRPAPPELLIPSVHLATPMDETAELERLQVLLTKLSAVQATHLGAPSQSTCRNVLRAGRTARPHAGAEQVAAFIGAELLSRRPERFRSWGGVVVALKDDFGKHTPARGALGRPSNGDSSVTVPVEGRVGEPLRPTDWNTSGLQFESWVTPEVLQRARVELARNRIIDREGRERSVELDLPDEEITGKILCCFRSYNGFACFLRDIWRAGDTQRIRSYAYYLSLAKRHENREAHSEVSTRTVPPNDDLNRNVNPGRNSERNVELTRVETVPAVPKVVEIDPGGNNVKGQ